MSFPQNLYLWDAFYDLLGCLPSKDIFHQRSSFIKFIFHQILSTINGPLPSKVIFHKRLSSFKGCLFPDLRKFQVGGTTGYLVPILG